MSSGDRRYASALEGAAVETVAGLIFTVKGIVHPPDRVVAYLRYVPDKRGERLRGRKRYRRVYSVAEREETLRARGLSYRVDDPMLGVPVDAVPWDDVTRVYDPRERLQRLRTSGPTARSRRTLWPSRNCCATPPACRGRRWA